MTDLVTKPLDYVDVGRFRGPRGAPPTVSGVAAGARGSARRPPREGTSPEANRALKERLVREGRAHAALVFDGDVAVAWCQYGSPAELPSIYHLKEYTAGPTEVRARTSVTCFFVGRYSGSGRWTRVGRARRGAGPRRAVRDVGGTRRSTRRRSRSFLYDGTRTLFERRRVRDRPKGEPRRHAPDPDALGDPLRHRRPDAAAPRGRRRPGRPSTPGRTDGIRSQALQLLLDAVRDGRLDRARGVEPCRARSPRPPSSGSSVTVASTTAATASGPSPAGSTSPRRGSSTSP